MPEYFETEESTRNYDPEILKRIVGYLRPYRLGVFLAFIALVTTTAGELFLPLIIQRVVDERVVPVHRLLKTARSDSRVDRLLSEPGVLSISNSGASWAFVPRALLKKLNRAEETALSAEGILAPDDWYTFSFRTGDSASAVVLEHSSHFVVDERSGGSEATLAAIRSSDLSALSGAERLAVRGGDVAALARWTALFAGILCAVLAATFIQTFATNLIGQKVMKDIRLSLFERTCSQSLAFISRHPVGRIVTRLTGDVETINQFFTEVLVAFLKDLTVMVGVLIVLFRLSPILAGVVSLTLPPVLVASAISRVKARDAFRRQRSAVSQVNAYLSERLSGIQVVQLFSQERRSEREFSERSGSLLKANLGEMYVFATFRPVVDLLASITTAAVILAGAVLYLRLSISLGVLIAFINLVGMFYSPLKDIAEKYTILQSAMAGGERVFKLLDADERIPDAPRVDPPSRIAGRIEFRSVRFAYKEGEDVLKGLSFTVDPGEMVAIVGYTGAGKTTITNLIARLWDVDEGSILLDGVPIRDLPLSSLRRSIVPVLQDVFLFSGSVSDNIRLGLPLSDQEVRAAAEAVYAHDFIQSLPNGYDTILSEGATNISSGQRQLISFARVVAHDPRIIILDEATSSIDTETERLIKAGMDRILRDRTSIVIAHRLSTIRHADRILVLSDGKLVESGSHEELLSLDRVYANLYRLQYDRGA